MTQFTPEELSILEQAAEIILRSQTKKPTLYEQQANHYQAPPALPGLDHGERGRLGLGQPLTQDQATLNLEQQLRAYGA